MSTSTLAPLKQPVFRMLWTAWLTANVCMWMNDIAAAWQMTSLSASPAMVALVQTASTLPVFLLGLPSGALADILDRRRYFMVTQFWVAAVAVLTCLVMLAGGMTPALLLGLTFANGIGLAMRWPVFAALVPELVSQKELPAALALNAIAMNASRIAGPLLAGALLASAGSPWVFALNAVLSVAAGLLIMRWRREARASSLPGERFLGAIRVGVQHVRQSSRMRVVLLRLALFFLHASALMALLPLVARQLPGGDAGTFTLLMAALGVGAISAALYLPRLRMRMNRDVLVRAGNCTQALATLVVAFAPNVWLALPAMLVAGMGWIVAANSLTMSAQLALPNWVRARGMSIYQMTLMGSSAAGAALWGGLASLSSVAVSLGTATACSLAGLWLTRHLQIEGADNEDFSPHVRPPPQTRIPIPPHAGPVLVTIEYRIDPARADAFREVMEETRRSRLRQGALSWELFHDTTDPGIYIEYLLDDNWVEHLRRFERFTASDDALRRRRLDFHIGEMPPVMRRCVAAHRPVA